MAKVTRENIGILHDKITVTVTPDEYSPAYKKSLAKAAASANIPGFRKGKVPLAVVNKMYGEKIIIDEVLKITEVQMSSYLAVEKIDTIAQPLPLSSTLQNIDINNLKEYQFVFEIGIRPEISIDPKAIQVKRYVIEVPEKFIEEQVDRIRLQFGTMTEPETVSSDEDLLNVVFLEVDADGNAVDGGIDKATSLNVKHFEAEFRKSLFGLKKEDSVTATLAVAFSNDERGPVLEELGLDKEDAASADKHFKITITNIGLQVKAELNEELYKKAYPTKEITNEVEFREAVKAEIAGYFAEQSRKQMHDQIYHFLIDETKVEFPTAFMLRLLEEGDEKRRSKEEAEKILPVFESQMKWSLITRQIQKEENITVTQDDLKNAAKAQIIQYLGGQVEMFGDTKFIDEFAERNAKDKKFVDEHYGNILADKIFTSLEDKVTATEEGIDYETFGSKLHHHHY